MSLEILFSGAEVLAGVQNSPDRSLGGYRSASSIPNAVLNALFDEIAKNDLVEEKEYYRAIILHATALLTGPRIAVEYENEYLEDTNECQLEFAAVALNAAGQI